MSSGFWRRKRVLVTGGAGFIGSNLVPRLLELGAFVRVVDNLERGKLEYLAPVRREIEFIAKDLRGGAVCKEAVRGIDTVFHLAAKVGGIRYYLDSGGEVILQNTLIDGQMLEASRAGDVECFVYASSAHVYPIELQGAPDARPLQEEDALPAHPELSYGWAKLLCEKQIEYLAHQGIGPRSAIVRLVGAYGENQDLDWTSGSAIPVFISRAVIYPKRAPFVMWGTGRETRSYCYISDVVEGLVRAAQTLERCPLLGPLNLGSEGRVTMDEVVRLIVSISGKDIPLVKDTSKPTAIWGQAVDCAKAREALAGWRPRVPLPEGLRRTYAHVERRIVENGDEPCRWA